MTFGSAETTGVVGVGYEGQSITTFIDGLTTGGVTYLVDVRMTPISRKPGFSKSALHQALTQAGIGYEHRPELGNPKSNRAGFAGTRAEADGARRAFIEWIDRPAARSALDALAELAQRKRVAVLCFEADQMRCHRDIVLAHVARRLPQRSG